MKSRQTSQFTRPGVTCNGRKPPPAVTIGTSAGWQYHGRLCRRPESGQATDVVRVSMGDDQMANVGRLPAALRNPAENVGVAAGQPGIDQNTSIRGVDQEGIDNPGWDHEQAGDNLPSSGHLHLFLGLTPN